MQSLLFIVAVLALAACTSAQMGNMTNGTDDELPASGSGRGPTCDDIRCTGDGTCRLRNDTQMPYCWCNPGSRLVGSYHCESCPVGYWGMGCSQTCADNCGGPGRVSSCNAVNGTCVCNKCWESDGATCNQTSAGILGYQCFLDFTAAIDKSLDTYGGEIPQPDQTKLRDLARTLVKQDTSTIIQEDSAKLTIIDRSDVGARQLARFSFTVLHQGTTDYTNAINAIKTDIKDGDYRATLIVDESDGSTAKVTVNV